MISAILLMALTACKKSSLFVGNDEYVTISYENLSQPNVTLLDRSQFVSFSISSLAAYRTSTGATGIALDDIQVVDRKGKRRSIISVSVEECEQLDCRNNEWEPIFAGTETGYAMDNNLMAVLVLDLNATLGTNLAQTKQTIKEFIADLYTISTETLIGVVAYSEKVYVTGLKTFDEQEEVYQFIDNIGGSGTYSGMYESCLQALNILNGTAFRGVKNLILFTDEGDETQLGAILKEEVQDAQVTRRVVALDGSLFTQSDEDELAELAVEDDHFWMVSDQTGLKNAFTEMEEQIRMGERFVYERPGDFVDRPRLIRFTFNLK